MIGRIWHGTTEAEKANDYLEFLYQTGIPDYRKTKGNLGAYVLRRIDNDKAHFLALSFGNRSTLSKHSQEKTTNERITIRETKNFYSNSNPPFNITKSLNRKPQHI